MKEIRVTTQAELDTIPENYDGCIKIYGKEPIKVSKRYIYAVRVYGDSLVSAFGNSSVYADDNSRVTAYGNSRVYAFDNSRVKFCGSPNETNKINIKGENKNTMENKNTDFIKQAAQHINALHKLCKDFNIKYFNVTCGKDYSSDFHSFEGEFRTFEGDIHYNEDGTYTLSARENKLIEQGKI